ncbi:hypothetical protein [Streptomyces olivaceoviridis]
MSKDRLRIARITWAVSLSKLSHVVCGRAQQAPEHQEMVDGSQVAAGVGE